MPPAKSLLFVALGLCGVGYLTVWGRQMAAARRKGAADHPAEDARPPSWLHLAVGFVTNFFDTLGIGSYATTTAMYRLRATVPDRLIPGTLNVGHTLATFAEAYIYIAIVQVEMTTLVVMIAASVAGAWLGAGVVAGWSRRRVQLGMGSALLAAAVLMLLGQLEIGPAAGEALGLDGARLAAGAAGNLVLGALMTLGIGLFAPCMILVYLLGMSAKVAFPIMMGSCAFLMPAASVRFIRERSYHLRAALGLALGGVPAVLIAAFIVKKLELRTVRWLVIVVVVYTAASMLRSAVRDRTAPTTQEP